MRAYLTQNNINKRFYVGQTIQDDKSYFGSGTALKHAMNKYGKENFTRETLEVCDSIDELNEAEIYWIDFFGFPNNPSLYNMNYGGMNSAHTPESKEKLRQANLGKKYSDEVKEKISKIHKGSKRSDETKKRMSEAALRISEETKSKRSESHKGMRHSQKTKNKLAEINTLKHIDDYIIFKLRMQGLSYQKIAEIFDCDRKTVSWRYERIYSNGLTAIKSKKEK